MSCLHLHLQPLHAYLADCEHQFVAIKFSSITLFVPQQAMLQLHMQDQKACLAVQVAWPSAGVICNNVVPEWLRVVLLTALLLFVVYKTAKKGKR